MVAIATLGDSISIEDNRPTIRKYVFLSSPLPQIKYTLLRVGSGEGVTDVTFFWSRCE